MTPVVPTVPTEPEEDFEWAIFCANGGMHCGARGDDHDNKLLILVDETHFNQSPHVLKYQRILRFPWKDDDRG